MFDKDNDVSKIQTAEFNLPLVNAKDGDNGIMYYGRECDFESAENTIDIINDGAVSTGNVYSQPQKTGVLYNAYLIKPFFPVNRSVLHFFTCAIKKSIKLKFGYENKAGWAKVREQMIFLPITKDRSIDFDFIEEFIAELEERSVAELEERSVAELEAWLRAAGFEDYNLTEGEQIALKEIDKLEYQIFNVEELFGKSTRGKRLKSADRVTGSLPFVTAGETDEGISAFIGNRVTIFPANTTTIDMFGSAKYRNYEYGADDHIAVVHTQKLQEDAAIFVTSAIHKSSHNGQFDYGKNFYAKDADELNILLPTNGVVPDYSKMATIISAVKKLVIKDVAEYANKKIRVAQQVIAK